jgi:hypothetical protein
MTQQRHWAGLLWPWHPPCDGPGAGPRLRVVGDPWEPSAQLDSSRQLSLLIKHGTDRGGISLGNDEHPNSMTVRTVADKRVHYHIGVGTASFEEDTGLKAEGRPLVSGSLLWFGPDLRQHRRQLRVHSGDDPHHCRDVDAQGGDLG